MKIVVASRNPVKIKAVAAAFAAMLPDTRFDTVGINVESGVADQPRGDEETRRGARQRADNARDAQPDAAYWVGLEGGVDVFDDTLMTFAWMSIRSADGRRGETRSVGLPLPAAIKVLVDDGLELGDANDQVFGTVNSKHQGGAFGLLTEGRYTRESVYVEALCVALVPLINPVYQSGNETR